VKKKIVLLAAIGAVMILTACEAVTNSNIENQVEETTTEIGVTEIGTMEVGATEVGTTEIETTENAAEEIESETEVSELTGILSVAVVEDRVPYAFYNKEELLGIDIEIMQYVAQELNKELVFKEMPADAIVSAVRAGKADVGITFVRPTSEEVLNKIMEKVEISDIYADSQQVIVVKAESKIQSDKDLRGSNIGVLPSSKGELLAKNISVQRLMRYDSVSEAMKWLEEEIVDALIIDASQIQAITSKTDEMRILDEVYAAEEYAFVVAKEDAQLLEQVDEIIARLKRSGELKEIIYRHIPVE